MRRHFTHNEWLLDDDVNVIFFIQRVQTCSMSIATDDAEELCHVTNLTALTCIRLHFETELLDDAHLNTLLRLCTRLESLSLKSDQPPLHRQMIVCALASTLTSLKMVNEFCLFDPDDDEIPIPPRLHKLHIDNPGVVPGVLGVAALRYFFANNCLRRLVIDPDVLLPEFWDYVLANLTQIEV